MGRVYMTPQLLEIRRSGRRLLFVKLEPGTMSLGADPSNDVILPGADIPGVLGRLRVEEDGRALLDPNFHPALELSRPTGAEGPLTSRDTLRVGEFRLALVEAGAVGPDTLDERRTRTRAAPRGEAKSQLRLQHAGREILVEAPSRVTVGSRPSNDIVIEDDPFVSGSHCQIAFENGGWMVMDLGSTNGTTVNGLRVEATRLPSRAVLGVGDVRIELSVGDEVTDDLPRSGEYDDFHGMRAVSPPMRTLFRRLERLARAEDPVFVHGESGVGKELISRALHSASPRASKRFVALNCATLTPQLSGAELFGYMKGAFTGADANRPGVFEETKGGTLFLDEIAELSLDVQATLLRTLETKTVRRLGSYQEVPVDVRIVAASHKDLAQCVANGTFRQDLMFRVKVLSLEVPPLRDRREDIPVLARYFLGDAPGVTLSSEAERALLAHSWPGNVRELRNVMRCALAMRETDVIDAEDLQLIVPSTPAPTEVSSAEPEQRATKPRKSTRRRSTLDDETTRRETEAALEESDWVAAWAAEKLGISKGAMHYRMARYGLLKKDG